MLHKYFWPVLTLALSAAANLAMSLTPSGPSCIDGAPTQRTHFHTDGMKYGHEQSVTMAGDTRFEELSSLGFNPQLNILSATIKVKLSYGFGGGLCTNGSREYVRFWVNYGSGWSSIGLSAVNTHDIADTYDCHKDRTKPLHYTLSINFQPIHRRCQIPVLPKVRATLSWGTVPVDDPFHIPEWGNTLEETIQSLALASYVPAVIYTGMDTMPSIDSMGVHSPKFDTCNQGQQVFGGGSQKVEHLDNRAFGTEFEELTGLGLDWDRKSLVATVRIKQRHGYQSTPCEKNSVEYVSFWADWRDSCDYRYLGTRKFNVHDFVSAPRDGLEYTAVLPVDILNFAAPCNETKIVRVRAALAFNALPPTPPKVAARGNFIETHVHLQPYSGIVNPTTPQITKIGNVDIEQIDTTTSTTTGGLTIPNAWVNGYGPADPSEPYDRRCPFGGIIEIKGEAVVGHAYRLMTRPYDPTFPINTGVPVTNPIVINNPGPGGGQIGVYPDSEGYFKYVPHENNLEDLLSSWTPGPGRWQIRLEMASIGPPHNHEGYTPWYMVVVNQADPITTGPLAHLDLGGLVCGDLQVGGSLQGSFHATSAYFDHWNFETLPGGLNPNSVTVEGGWSPLTPVPEPGRLWQLATTSSQACGYVVRLWVWDRTIVNSGRNRYSYTDDKGFCLRN